MSEAVAARPRTPRRQRILFVAEAVTLAHVTRPLVLAQSLPSEHFEVHFACAAGHDLLFKDTGFTHWPIHSISSVRFLRALAGGARLYDRQTLESYVEEDCRLLEQVRPDLVVGDFRLSLAVSAPLNHVPYAALANAYWSPYTTRRHFPMPELPVTRFLGVPLTRAVFHVLKPLVFRHHAQPVNALRRRHGLPALGNMLHVYTHGDYTLLADLPSLVPVARLPANHRYLGPILWSPPVELPPWWHTLEDSQPVIYVTLGSSGRVELLPVVIETLGELPVTALVATAGRMELAEIPNNIRVAAYLPGSAAARRSALVICNGGSPTSYQALAEGVPVLGIASNMDQHLMMSAVEEAGAGLLLRAGRVTKASLRQAVTRILGGASYRHKARALAEEASHFQAPLQFRAFIEEVTGG